jgi:hypothetical protein
MSFLELPAELLFSIVEHVMPEGFESLMMSCRTIYATGKDLVERHNALRRKYRTFKYDSEIQCSLQLLCLIAKDPLIARYIEAADFSSDHIPCSLQDLEQRSASLAGASTISTIRSLVHESICLRVADESPDEWLSKIEHQSKVADDAFHASTFLLTTLTNLSNLTLPKFWDVYPAIARLNTYGDAGGISLHALLQSIVSKACDTASQSPALGKLTHIHPFLDAGYESRADLQTLDPFLALPSLRKLSIASLTAHRGFEWQQPSITSNITSIEMACCCMTGQQLGKLLLHTPKLRSFKYSHETKWHGICHEWNYSAFILSVGHHCGNTLRELSVTVDTCYGDTGGAETDLKDFTVLEDLELDVGAFLYPSLEYILRDLDFHEENCVSRTVSDWTLHDIPCLAELLPLTLKRLRLVCGTGLDEPIALQQLFNHLKDRSEAEVPILNEISVVRGTTKVGSEASLISSVDPVSEWEKAEQAITSNGGSFEVASVARAAWLNDFGRRYPGILT